MSIKFHLKRRKYAGKKIRSNFFHSGCFCLAFHNDTGFPLASGWFAFPRPSTGDDCSKRWNGRNNRRIYNTDGRSVNGDWRIYLRKEGKEVIQ